MTSGITLDQPEYINRILTIADISQDHLKTINSFLNILNQWNQTFNLISKSQYSNVYYQLIDSVFLAYYIKGLHQNTIADFGSGGGFPVVVCAIINPDKSFYIYERDQNKSSFLKQVAVECKIPNLRFNQDFKKSKQKYDLVISKAALVFSNFIQILSTKLELFGTGIFFINPTTFNWSNLGRSAKNMLISSVLYHIPTLDTKLKQSINDKKIIRGFLVIRR